MLSSKSRQLQILYDYDRQLPITQLTTLDPITNLCHIVPNANSLILIANCKAIGRHHFDSIDFFLQAVKSYCFIMETNH